MWRRKKIDSRRNACNDTLSRRDACVRQDAAQIIVAVQQLVSQLGGRHRAFREVVLREQAAQRNHKRLWLALAIAEYRLTAERHEENEHQPTTTTNITNDNEYSKQQRTFQTATNTNNDRRLGAMMTLTDGELIIRKLLRTRTRSVYGYATLR